MATAMMVAVGVLALVVFVLCGVVYELFRDVRQLRDVAGILDRPLEVEIGTVAGTRPSTHGLPQALDSAASALVLFLSDRCGTCRSLAAGLEPQGSVKVPECLVHGLVMPSRGRTRVASRALRRRAAARLR